MEREYRLTGTLPELQKLLQQEFDMDFQEAKFAACLLALEQISEKDEIDEEQAALWFLQDSDEYATAILQTRFSISLTDACKNLIGQLATPVLEILTGLDSFTIINVLACVGAIVSAVTYIKDNECCAYFQALKWKAIHPSEKYFMLDEIFPNTPDGFCLYLNSEKWTCTKCHKEICEMDKTTFKQILDELCDRNVFKKFNNMYQFTV